MSLPTFTSKWTNCFTLMNLVWNLLWHHFQRPLIGGPKLKRSTYNKPPSSWNLNLHILQSIFQHTLWKIFTKAFSARCCVQLWLKKAVVPNNNRAKPKKKNSFDIFFKEPAEETSSETSSRNKLPSKAQRELVLYGSCTSKSLISWISKSNR